MLEKLNIKTTLKTKEKSFSGMTSPVSSVLKNLSKHALDLYVKKADINKFTKLALSNPQDKSHNEIVKKLFEQENIIDPLSEENLSGLIGNENFLKDLGF